MSEGSPLSRLAAWSRSRNGAWFWLAVGTVGVVVGVIGLGSDGGTGSALIGLIGVMLLGDALATLYADRWPTAAPVLRIGSVAAAVAALVVLLGDVFGWW